MEFPRTKNTANLRCFFIGVTRFELEKEQNETTGKIAIFPVKSRVFGFFSVVLNNRYFYEKTYIFSIFCHEFCHENT